MRKPVIEVGHTSACASGLNNNRDSAFLVAKNNGADQPAPLFFRIFS